jgi:hypothetical protein
LRRIAPGIVPANQSLYKLEKQSGRELFRPTNPTQTNKALRNSNLSLAIVTLSLHLFSLYLCCRFSAEEVKRKQEDLGDFCALYFIGNVQNLFDILSETSLRSSISHEIYICFCISCGLWVLLHSLTVRIGDGESQTTFTSICDFIHNFFICEECRTHFYEMCSRFGKTTLAIYCHRNQLHV